MTRSHRLVLIVAVVLTTAACAGSDTADTTSTTGTAPSATASSPETTTAPTTTVAETTTTSPVVPGLDSPDDYPVSDDYVVETVAADIDAGTGGLTLDAEGNLYTADFGYTGHDGNTLFKISPDGSVEPFATHETMDQLTGNRVAPDGTIYQSSYGSGYVYRIDRDGGVEVVTDQMTGPTGVVLTDEGRLLVLDCNRNAVYEVLADGSAELFAGGITEGMRCPNGVTQDPDGNLYVVNYGHGQLMKVSSDGSELSVLHSFPGGNAHVVYYDGMLFITARETNHIFRYDLATGEVDVIAGTGEAGLTDGPGPEATFGSPNAIVVDEDGNIYFNHGSDTGLNPTAIRVLRPAG
jgi:sugar lactone lactonase YvrE